MKICRSFDFLFSEYSKKLEGEKRYNGKVQLQVHSQNWAST